MMIHSICFSSAATAQAVLAGQGSGGEASHEIVMRARVAPSCRITDAAVHIVLSGVTDAGEKVESTLSGRGGFTVDCNTPFAVDLRRSTFYSAAGSFPVRSGAVGAPAHVIGRARRVAAAPNSGGAGIDAGASNGYIPAASGGGSVADVRPDAVRDIEVVVRTASLEGQFESICVMHEDADVGFVCNALSGPDDPRLPLLRGQVDMILTGSVAEAGVSRREEPTAGQSAFGSIDLASTGGSEDAAPAGAGTGRDDAAARAAADRDEIALVERAMARSGRVRMGDRLTVSLTPRH
ncbi:MAG: hypothetical protein KDJ37_00280 [Hyphomicrobiaceae bacterium]|nr:hypothetical protein [Hyphomicrobiaceae bacterium]